MRNDKKKLNVHVGVTHHPRKPKGFLHLCLWAVLLASILVAWYTPINSAIEQRRGMREPSGPRDAQEFLALIYQRERDISGAPLPYLESRIADHFEALHANGFQPISVQHVLALLRQGTPLPRRAFLLVLDGSDADLLQHAERAARKYRWGGVVLTATHEPQQSEDSASWRDLAALLRSRRWDIGTYGHLGNTEIPVSPDGDTANHLTSRMWLSSQDRLETPDEFTARILADHEQATRVMDQRLGTLPRVYAFPQGDAGQFAQMQDAFARLNAAAVGSIYDLAFVTTSSARNTLYTPPDRLNLLPVNPDWTGQQFLDEVMRTSRKIEMVEDLGTEQLAGGWHADWGRATIDSRGLTLSPAGAANGSRVWLGGSDLIRDFQARVKLRVRDGGVGFLLRSDPVSGHGVLIDFLQNGSVEISQRTAHDAPYLLIARSTAPLLNDILHDVNITLRANTLNVQVDGISIFQQALRLPAETSPGLFGIVLFDETGGRDASLTITSAALQRPSEKLASWNLSERAQPYLVDFVHRNGSMLTNLSPPLWLPGSRDASAEEDTLLRKLAGVYGLRLTPKVSIRSNDDMRVWNPDVLARAVLDQRSDGVFVSFEHHENLSVSALDNWLQQAGRLLSGAGKPILVRLPRTLERLAAINAILAVVPSIEIVTDTDASAPSGFAGRSIEEVVIQEPSLEQLNHIPPARTIPEQPAEGRGGLRDQIATLSASAEQAFNRGAFETAIAYFAEWHELSPSSPRPLRRIGDSLVNLGYHDEATGFYRQALDLAPEDIQLATQLARLLLETGRTAESRSLLNIYARLFPRNTSILLAQAEWLFRQNRPQEAAGRIQQIESLDPDNFDAILFQLRIADHDEARKAAIERLISISRTLNKQQRLIEAIADHDLLTFQSSHLLVGLMNDLYRETQDPKIKRMIENLDPLTERVVVDFSQDTRFSDRWTIDGASSSHSDSALTVRANPARNRIVGRLLRSERWRDSFIEVDLAQASGGLWLHAREARNQLVRMGFEPAQNRLHLQVWGGPNNEVLESQFIPWGISPTGTVLRLEVRGKGVVGYVDGKAMFETALEVPEDFGFGWTAFSVESPVRGEAQAVVRRVSSGQLPFRAAIVPVHPPGNDNADQLDLLHKSLRFLTDVSPQWFRVDAEGTWESRIHPESDFYRIFTRYYRLRLSPLVQIETGGTVDAEDLIALCRTHGYNGLVLWFDQMPSREWFEEMDRALTAPGLDIIAVSGRPGNATVRGIAASSTLFPRRAPQSELHIIETQTNEQWDANRKQLESMDPGILLF